MRISGCLKLLFLACLLLFSRPARAEFIPFSELWNTAAYYDTNLERKNFASILARYEGKLGFFVFDSPLQLYGAYYGVASQSNDYYNNALFVGPGIRLKPFTGYKSTAWFNGWVPDLKIYAETLSSTYFKNAASAEANKKNDLRYGIELWHEWNQDNPDLKIFWSELYLNLCSRSTNFSAAEENPTILLFQPKIGRYLGPGLEVYAKADIALSDKTDYWLNTAAYGMGIRFEPWRQNAAGNSFFKKFKMFIEVLKVSYFKDLPAETNKTVSKDVRFGIDFSYGR